MEELSHLINQGLAGTRQVTMAAGDLARLSEDLRGSMDRFIVTGVKPRLSGRHDLSTARPALARRTTEVSGEIGLASMRRTTEVSGELQVGRGADSGPQRAMPGTSRKSAAMPGLAGAGATAPRKPQPTPIQSPMQSSHQPSHPAPSSELNATMRFLGYSEDGSVVAGDPPTVSVTPNKARQYNEVDDLFDALPSKAPGRSTSSLSFEDHASDLERHLDEGKGDPRDDQ
jgi:hypothetical protein